MYKYTEEKQKLFTDEGQRLFLIIRGSVLTRIEETGAITMGQASRLPSGIGAADGWTLMACVDRMVEIGELREIEHGATCGQDRIFIRS